MKTSSFDFDLPEELIAQIPYAERDKCRLMVLHGNGAIEHRNFPDIINYLSRGDLLILNDTRVLPARLTGYKHSGYILEILLVREIETNKWEILSKGSYTGRLKISGQISAYIYNGKTAVFTCDGNIKNKLWKYGEMPIPPYIKRKATASDRDWYQTVFAKKEGSIAAPTAGLHFSRQLIREINDIGVKIRYITLHIGTGTFLPIKTDEVEQHRMHSEYFEISSSLLNEIEENIGSGKRVLAVGTTATRAIEGFLSDKERYNKGNGGFSGYTDVFIYPGYDFKAVNALLTNFHLPNSTPILLSSAMAGRENLLKGYEEAVRMKYRFFSYGDAMLIL
ncbi:S-adenosylmethionine:tRNA ribosyltransferase-isomerase [bacterium BMS3Abin07]|nr:S-adenosylmethionine:tRNA ribosyltransferase-isomerase [bacterium BMS3Abin07]GBE31505.1 S-adenosylmethionine:tRNA ribosyltransferase-isomerase [bacterium BMS3Bbin05]HDL19906.1 tRNA preQ1(34) S-adenosylmethionine ribosyltransferase-isomerase QueA [Nitrospirota bacterium]HDO22580.1 tRNA preQ1(34) S-adenosylmethionine ribosyltransferase-isomerase QueA [Nitrospirota bacterium]HDZ87084.1 tRNA preQ1(34) S-adenosylmethionine ribosyltransferase-isomerase QueA [Nitrospirota bacterium]